MHTTEILLLQDYITAEDWHRFVRVIGSHVRGIRPLDIIVVFEGSVVRYFAQSRYQLSNLSQGLDGFLLRDVDDDTIGLAHTPEHTKNSLLLRIPVGGNIFDLRERYKIKKGKELFYLKLKIQKIGSKYTSKMHTYFKTAVGVEVIRQQLSLVPTHLLAADFIANSTYLHKSAPKYVNIEKATPLLLSDNISAMFSVDTFPYLPHDYYLNLTSYEFDKHSFIVGASGSGKSKLIELFVRRLQTTALAMNYRVVVIDPHASLADDLQSVANSKVINFSHEGAQLFPEANADVSAATELTTTLFKSLLADQFNPSLERTLRFSLFVLFTAQAMDLNNLKKFLVDTDYRTQILDHVRGFVPDNVSKFFGADFNELKTQRYNEAFVPIIAMVDELQLQPTVAGSSDLSLISTINSNFLTVFSLNKVTMGEKVVKTVAGLLIQQIFLLAQARVFGQRVILIIDEVSIVQNPAIASMLAEARKFNLSVILTQQYLGQIDQELQSAIVSNVINYYIFKLSEEDARKIEGNIQIDIPKEMAERELKNGRKESDLRAQIMTELNPRECLLRISANGQLYPAIKARTEDIVSVATVDSTIKLQSYKQINLPTKFVEKSLQGSQPGQVNNEPVFEGFGPRMSDVLLTQSSSRLRIKK